MAESGVPLKIRHNAVLGYFVETTRQDGRAAVARRRSNATFIHRQTLANQVRFTTVELAELDARIAQAAERALAIEVETFEAWRAAASQRWPGRSRPRPRPWPARRRRRPGRMGRGRRRACRPVVDRSPAFEAEAAPPPGGRGRGHAAPASPSRPTTAAWTAPGDGCAAPVDRHRPEHGRQVDLPAPERAAGRAGPGRLLRARQAAAAGRRRPAVQPRRAPATTWRAAARPSWPRWSRPPPS